MPPARIESNIKTSRHFQHSDCLAKQEHCDRQQIKGGGEQFTQESQRELTKPTSLWNICLVILTFLVLLLPSYFHFVQ